MARKPSYKMLDRRIVACERGQDVVVTEIGQLGTHKLKFFLRSNAYKFQGSATVSRFDGEKWQVLYSIPAEGMKTGEGLIYKVKRPISNPNDPAGVSFEANFVTDYALLRKEAELILL